MLATGCGGVTPEMAVRLAKFDGTRAGMAIIADMLRGVAARQDRTRTWSARLLVPAAAL